MPGFITDQQLNDALCDQLQKARGSLVTPTVGFWAGLITAANVWAYNEIIGRLVARGFTLAQVTAWDRGAEFQQDLGIWKCLEKGAAMAPDTYSREALAYLDRRDELSGNLAKKVEACIVTIGSVFQPPLTTVGNPNNGVVQGMRVPSPLQLGCGFDEWGQPCPWGE